MTVMIEPTIMFDMDYESDNGDFDSYEENEETDYDDDSVTCDDEYDSIYQTEESELLSIYNRPHIVRAPKPIQLAADESCFETLHEMQQYYSQLLREQQQELDEMVEKIVLGAKKQLKLKELERENSLLKKEEKKEEKKEDKQKSTKRQQNNQWFANRCRSRRRRGLVIPTKEVVKARRANRRREVKERKRKEETERAIEFASRGVITPTSNVVKLKLEEDEQPQDDDEQPQEDDEQQQEDDECQRILKTQQERQKIREVEESRIKATQAEMNMIKYEEWQKRKCDEQEKQKDINELLAFIEPVYLNIAQTERKTVTKPAFLPKQEEGWEIVGKKEHRKPVIKPVVNHVVKPVVNHVVKPVAKPVVNHVVKPVAKPIVKPVVKVMEEQLTNFQRGEEIRDHALKMLADEEQIRLRKKCTKMCNSVVRNEPCKHGVNCRFAHSVDELTISECFFGSNCRFVDKYNGIYKNIGHRVCKHIHPKESEDNFYKRTGLQDPRVKTPVAQPVRQQPVRQQPVRQPVWTQPETQPETQPVNLSNKVQNTPHKSEVKSLSNATDDEEIVLRVPKELAIQAMELAIKSGNKRIRVEII